MPTELTLEQRKAALKTLGMAIPEDIDDQWSKEQKAQDAAGKDSIDARRKKIGDDLKAAGLAA